MDAFIFSVPSDLADVGCKALDTFVAKSTHNNVFQPSHRHVNDASCPNALVNVPSGASRCESCFTMEEIVFYLRGQPTNHVS